jgi:hypothetical protein
LEHKNPVDNMNPVDYKNPVEDKNVQTDEQPVEFDLQLLLEHDFGLVPWVQVKEPCKPAAAAAACMISPVEGMVLDISAVMLNMHVLD